MYVNRQEKNDFGNSFLSGNSILFYPEIVIAFVKYY